MNFVGLFKRGDDLEKLRSNLEEDMADMLLSELSTPPLLPEMEAHDEALEMLPGVAPAPAEAELAEDGRAGERRLTQYAQSKLSALAAFEEMFQGTRQDLQLLGTTFAKVTSAHHMTRDFLSSVHAHIHHGNELELSNVHLQMESRKLARQVEETNKALLQRESAIEALEQREIKLTQENENLRMSLTGARVETADANHAIANLEAERAELMTALASKSVTAEKLLRENEVLREKHINLSMDLDSTLNKQTEAQRKYDELSAIHSRESAQSAERLAKLVSSEKEILRLQKQNDGLQSRIQEFSDSIRALEGELEEVGKRHRGEAEALKREIQSLNSKLQVSARAQDEKASEAAALKLKLNDAISEARVAAEKLEALRAEHARDRKELSTATANLSALSLQHTSEHVMLDMHKHEADELRREIAALRARLNAGRTGQPALVQEDTAELAEHEVFDRSGEDAADETAEEPSNVVAIVANDAGAPAKEVARAK
jgi:chromosome segregation ATPase